MQVSWLMFNLDYEFRSRSWKLGKFFGEAFQSKPKYLPLQGVRFSRRRHRLCQGILPGGSSRPGLPCGTIPAWTIEDFSERGGPPTCNRA